MSTIIHGVLVTLGTPPESNQPRAIVHCTEAQIQAVKRAAMMQPVVIVATAEYGRLQYLIIEARSALIASGCKDDDLMNRLRAEISPPPDQGQAQIKYRD